MNTSNDNQVQGEGSSAISLVPSAQFPANALTHAKHVHTRDDRILALHRLANLGCDIADLDDTQIDQIISSIDLEPKPSSQPAREIHAKTMDRDGKIVFDQGLQK